MTLQRNTAMQTYPAENGVADELQRIERDFQRQRDQLDEESSRFASWQTEWEVHQQSIDASLAQLKARLRKPDQDLVRTALKIFISTESASPTL